MLSTPRRRHPRQCCLLIGLGFVLAIASTAGSASTAAAPEGPASSTTAPAPPTSGSASDAITYLTGMVRAGARRSVVPGKSALPPIDTGPAIVGERGHERDVVYGEHVAGLDGDQLSTSFELTIGGIAPATREAETLTGSFDGKACPDAKGVVHAEAAGSNTFYRLGLPDTQQTFSLKIKIQVNDDAEIANVEFEGEFGEQVVATRAKPGNDRSRTELSYDGHHSKNIATVVESGPFEKVDAKRVGEKVGQKARALAETAARKFAQIWRDGHTCVNIQVKSGGPAGSLKPRQKVTIKARGVATDGAEIKKSLEGELVDGSTALDAGAGDVPTVFEYTGPKAKDTGTVLLTSRSRRGIGKRTLVYSTESDYRIDGMAANERWTATKCGGFVGRWDVNIVGPEYSSQGASFTLEKQPEPGSPVTVVTPEIRFHDPDPDVEYYTNYQLTFYADGADTAWGAPRESPALGIDEALGGTGLPIEAGSFCKDAK
jgi:hypothetical protein